MALTFGLTGMDPATESSLEAAFREANARLGGIWELVPEKQAKYVLVDMDSMYGPMSWLRLHAAGKAVIGLTSAPSSQADHHLAQPFDADSLQRLLQEIAPPAATVQATRPAGLTPSPRPQDQLPEEQPLPADEEDAPPGHPAAADAQMEELHDPAEPPSTAVARVVPAAPTLQPAEPPAPDPVKLADWLASGRLRGRVKLERDGVPLYIDAERRQYHGPSSLKRLATHVDDVLTEQDFELDPPGWEAEAAATGEAQPLTRLVWLGGLLAGKGGLLPGFDPESRYRLLRWPQSEREYPRHFRIATVMMKGPATLAEIAAASGASIADVTDFVNANLVTGYADIERDPEPEPDSPRTRGLFGRLRGR